MPIDSLPEGAQLASGGGSLERLALTTPGAEAHLYLHGAHLTHFQPQGERPVLWMSEHSAFSPGRPIRGGVPICFPWFGGSGPAGSPNHGVARLRTWEFISARVLGIVQAPAGAFVRPASSRTPRVYTSAARRRCSSETTSPSSAS